jgi:MtN3 and saliva related transmembrane protein
MSLGYHHYHKRQRSSKKSPSPRLGLKKLMDKLVYIVGVSGVLVTIPQLLQIWESHTAQGVSLFSWIGLLVGTIFWLFYGIVHEERPLIITNTIIASLQFFVVISIIIYR